MGNKARFLETVLSNALWGKVRRRRVRQPQKLLGGTGREGPMEHCFIGESTSALSAQFQHKSGKKKESRRKPGVSWSILGLFNEHRVTVFRASLRWIYSSSLPKMDPDSSSNEEVELSPTTKTWHLLLYKPEKSILSTSNRHLPSPVCCIFLRQLLSHQHLVSRNTCAPEATTPTSTVGLSSGSKKPYCL